MDLMARYSMWLTFGVILIAYVWRSKRNYRKQPSNSSENRVTSGARDELSACPRKSAASKPEKPSMHVGQNIGKIPTNSKRGFFMIPAIIYARVSSREQEQEGYSIPAQLKLLKAYASKNGLEVL
jgi:hypothetical protein